MGSDHDDTVTMATAMPQNDKVDVATASKRGEDMPMAIDDEVAALMTPGIREDQIPFDNENQPLSSLLSHGQVDGNADTKKVYVPAPKTKEHAKIQGLALLKEMLNDPGGEIAHHIKNAIGWLHDPLASNERCKKVQQCLTGKSQLDVTDKTVPFILATWCMLGGFIPSMWREKVEDKKSGSKTALTERGKKMLEELENLGGEHEFEYCKRYAKQTGGKKPNYDYADAVEELMKPDIFAEQTKTKSKRTPKPTSLGKHGESSPRQPPAAKRPKAVASQRSGGSHAGDDYTEDEEGRVEVCSDIMGGGKKTGPPASKTPFTNFTFSCPGSPRPQMPKHDHRDQEDVPPQMWGFSGPRHIKGFEDTLGNSSISRPFGPVLDTSNMCSTTKYPGWNAQKLDKDCFVEELPAPDLTAGMPSSSYRYPTSSSAQPLLEVGSALQQGPTASPGRTQYKEPALTSCRPEVQPGYGSEHEQGPMVRSSHPWKFIDQIENLKESAQQEINQRIVHYESVISSLKEELSVSVEEIKAKDAKIAALEKEVKAREAAVDNRAQLERKITELQGDLEHSRQVEADQNHVLDTTTAQTIMSRAISASMNRGLSTVSLRELLNQMQKENAAAAADGGGDVGV